MRKLATAAAVGVTTVSASLLISGTAFAGHVEYKGPYDTADECVHALRGLPHDPTVDGLECVPMNGKHYIEISHTN